MNIRNMFEKDCLVVTSDGRKIPLRVESLDFSPLKMGVDITGTLLRDPRSMGVLKNDLSPIERVIFNDPATIVIWKDGTKTIVKCQPGDSYSEELGLAMCISKKYLGNKGNFNEVFKKWIPEKKSVEFPLEWLEALNEIDLSETFRDTMYRCGKSLVELYKPKECPESKISRRKMLANLSEYCNETPCNSKDCLLFDKDCNWEKLSDDQLKELYYKVFNKEASDDSN